MAKERKYQLPALNLVFLVTQRQLTVFLLLWWEKTAHTGHYFRFSYNLNSKEAQWRTVLANSTKMGGGAGWRQGCPYLDFPEQVKLPLVEIHTEEFVTYPTLQRSPLICRWNTLRFPSGCPKLWIVPNLIYILCFFLYLHTYDQVQFNKVVRD